PLLADGHGQAAFAVGFLADAVVGPVIHPDTCQWLAVIVGDYGKFAPGFQCQRIFERYNFQL
ncbi:MAG: hypothetical protein V1791_07605, partial [Pseudomonadota bacterium]